MRVGRSVLGAMVLGLLAAVAVPTAAHAGAAACPSATGLGNATAAGAVNWFKARNGCPILSGDSELAVERAWGARGPVWRNAYEHWTHADHRYTNTKPPLGAYVYWKFDATGDVGISDGNGGFWITDATISGGRGKIGHIKGSKARPKYRTHYSNYLGWTPGSRPHR